MEGKHDMKKKKNKLVLQEDKKGKKGMYRYCTGFGKDQVADQDG